MINKLTTTAMQGVHRSMQGVTRNAAALAQIARPGNKADPTRALVEMKQHEQAAKANIKTLAVADKLIGSLLDVKA